MKSVLLLLALSALALAESAGQPPPVSFGRFFNEDGLSHNTVWAISQDRTGYMWFGTFDGLNRYDGYAFKVYKHDPADPGSLVNNFILATHTDRKGNLWIATAEGIDRYDPAADNFIHYQPDLGSRHANYYVNLIYEDAAGRIWIGAQNGLNRFDPRQNRFVHVAGGWNTRHTEALAEDPDGTLWVGRKDGLVRLDPHGQRATAISPPAGHAGELTVKALARDRSGRLWVGTATGLLTYDRQRGQLQPFHPERLTKDILTLVPDRKGDLWIGTNLGLSVYHPATGTFTQHDTADDKHSLSDEVARAVYEDRDGNVWIGTFNGLNLINADRKNFHLYQADPKVKIKNYTLDFGEDRAGNLWVLTGGGIYVLDKGTQSLRCRLARTHPLLEKAERILIDRVGKFYVSSGGLALFDPATNQLSPYPYAGPEPLPRDIIALRKDRRGNLWMGTLDHGVYVLDPANRLRRYVHQPGRVNSLANNHVNTIIEDRRGDVWLGTHGGLERFDPANDAFIHHRNDPADKRSISHNAVVTITEDHRGDLWLGTGMGLNKLVRSTGTFVAYDRRHGLPGDAVNGIQEDDRGNLWLSTNKGIARFDPARGTSIAFDVHAGLQGNQFNPNVSARSRDGALFFGGVNGANGFYPDCIRYNRTVPPVVISDFQILNKPVPLGNGSVLRRHISQTAEMTLSYKHSVFSFGFEALNYSSPGKNRYAYKMEGFDEDWIYSGDRRFATYTNLPSGRAYTFRVKASNNDGVWNEKGASVRIYITPPFWETLWFRGLALLTLAGGVYAVYSIRVRTIKRQKAALEREVQARTAQVVMQKEELRAQAEQIEEMNRLLQRDNEKLEGDVKNLSKARVMQKRVTFEEFKLIYPDDDSCYRYLEEVKWGRGYECKKCGNGRYSPGTAPYSRRCSRCNYIETITAGTVFSRLKFSITKAFYILFLVSGGKDITVDELSAILSLRRDTCWNFKKKVTDVIGSRSGAKKNKDGWSHLILTVESEAVV